MVEVKNLNDDNFFLYAASHYENVNCFDTNEFYEDLNRLKYLKRLFSRYYMKDELKERLILNHLITLYNVFDFRAITRILFFKVESAITTQEDLRTCSKNPPFWHGQE